MSWYSIDKTFPSAVRNAMLPPGTRIHDVYVLGEAICVCGLELTYAAQDTRTQQPVRLRELLPMRWCMRDENGSWVPYHAEAASLFETVKQNSCTLLARLQQLHEEAALEPILDLFEAAGTIWIVTPDAEEQSLAQAIAGKLFTPQEAVSLLTPVMDTLLGLHEEQICHGAISAHSVMLRQDAAVLTSWCTGISGEPLSPDTDVRDVSCLLYRMMTGEKVYRAETAAALPRGIRRALKKGMEHPEIGMEQLWKLLHKDKPARRTIRMQHRASGSTGLGKLFSPAFTAAFCILCCAVPVSLAAAAIHGVQLSDTAYQLSEGEIRVPELLYLTQEDAVQTAESLGLHVVIASREDNPVVQTNCIVTQKPNAGAVLKAGDTIQLTVSDGWKNYVPDVCNMLLEEAVERLEELGFAVTYEEILSVGDAPGSVISQSVAPDTFLARDSAIHLRVSLGMDDLDASKLETVGNYVGMEFEEAKQLLGELHLYALQADAVYDPEVPKGVVISQEIPEGRRVSQGTVINMIVSLGVETTRVPQVTMMNVNSARSVLEQARLKAVIIYAADANYAADTVISQGTNYNTVVPVDSEIWLTVSTGKGSSVVSTGGWSGTPLPTVESTETSATEMPTAETQDTMSTEQLPTETDTTEPVPAESSTERQPQPTAPDPTESSEEQPTSSETASDTAAPSTETDPQPTEPQTDPPTEPPTAPPTDPPAEEEPPAETSAQPEEAEETE